MGILVAGIDVGAATAKAVILSDGEVLGYAVSPTGHDIKSVTNRVIRSALEKGNLASSIDSVQYVVSTGYGRGSVEFADKTITEIICHARGAHFLLPSTGFVVDIGGQDSKAIEVSPEGSVTNFIMNDKCAAGTGRFLEVMAQVLEVGSIDEMGPLALSSGEPCTISSTCTVFAETEVVVLRGEGNDRKDLIAGVHKAVSSRVAAMASRLKIKPDAVFTGGVAKNSGVKHYLEEELGITLHVPDEPQIVGALGAALFAQIEVAKQR